MAVEERLGDSRGLPRRGAQGSSERYARMRPVPPFIPDPKPHGYMMPSDQGLQPDFMQPEGEVAFEPIVVLPPSQERVKPRRIVLPRDEAPGFNPKDWGV